MCMCACMYVCICMRVCVYACIYVYMCVCMCIISFLTYFILIPFIIYSYFMQCIETNNYVWICWLFVCFFISFSPRYCCIPSFPSFLVEDGPMVVLYLTVVLFFVFFLLPQCFAYSVYTLTIKSPSSRSGGGRNRWA